MLWQGIRVADEYEWKRVLLDKYWQHCKIDEKSPSEVQLIQQYFIVGQWMLVKDEFMWTFVSTTIIGAEEVCTDLQPKIKVLEVAEYNMCSIWVSLVERDLP